MSGLRRSRSSRCSTPPPLHRRRVRRRSSPISASPNGRTTGAPSHRSLRSCGAPARAFSCRRCHSAAPTLELRRWRAASCARQRRRRREPRRGCRALELRERPQHAKAHPRIRRALDPRASPHRSFESPGLRSAAPPIARAPRPPAARKRRRRGDAAYPLAFCGAAAGVHRGSATTPAVDGVLLSNRPSTGGHWATRRSTAAAAARSVVRPDGALRDSLLWWPPRALDADRPRGERRRHRGLRRATTTTTTTMTTTARRSPTLTAAWRRGGGPDGGLRGTAADDHDSMGMFELAVRRRTGMLISPSTERCQAPALRRCRDRRVHRVDPARSSRCTCRRRSDVHQALHVEFLQARVHAASCLPAASPPRRSPPLQVELEGRWAELLRLVFVHEVQLAADIKAYELLIRVGDALEAGAAACHGPQRAARTARGCRSPCRG